MSRLEGGQRLAMELSRGEASRESTLSRSEGQQGGQGVQNAMK